MKGKIFIEGYKIHCVIGVHAHERKQMQEVIVDLCGEVDFTESVLNDSITDTINYEKFVSICQKLAHERTYNLIETFAYEALHALFEAIPTLLAATIRVKKPSALPLAAFAGVELTKTREE